MGPSTFDLTTRAHCKRAARAQLTFETSQPAPTARRTTTASIRSSPHGTRSTARQSMARLSARAGRRLSGFLGC